MSGRAVLLPTARVRGCGSGEPFAWFWLGRWEPHDVAHATQGVQQVRLCRIDLAAQHRDVGLDDAGVAAEVVVPDVVEYLHLGENPASIPHEVPQQLELGR